MTTSIKLASRGSTLALTQSRMISAALEKAHRGLRVEIVEIKTSGDVKLGQSLQAIGGKGAFTKELEDALLEKRADLAVHSLKDLPTTLPEGLTVGCTPPREDVADVLLLREHQPLNELTEDPFHLLREKAVLGSSSLRRKAQALMHRADLKIIEFRGNVDTRLRKLEEGKADACLLALAGLKRLGLMDSLDKRFGVFILPPSWEDLSRRLHARAQDSETVIQQRLELGKDEIAHWGAYDYVIVNKNFDRAYADLIHIYRAERLKPGRNIWLPEFVVGLLNEG
mgnify:CR=1 FL=1